MTRLGRPCMTGHAQHTRSVLLWARSDAHPGVHSVCSWKTGTVQNEEQVLPDLKGMHNQGSMRPGSCRARQLTAEQERIRRVLAAAWQRMVMGDQAAVIHGHVRAYRHRHGRPCAPLRRLAFTTWSALGRSLLCGTAAVLAGLAAGSAGTRGQRARMLLSRRVSGAGVRTVAAAAVAAAGRLRCRACRAGLIPVQALAAEQPQYAAGRGMRAVSWRRGLRLPSRIRVRVHQSRLRILAQCRQPAAVGGVSRLRSSMVGMQATHRGCKSAAHTGDATKPGNHYA